MVQFPTPKNPGQGSEFSVIDPIRSKQNEILLLPPAYTQVLPTAVNEDPHVPLVTGPIIAKSNALAESNDKEYSWLKSLETLPQKKELDKNDNISWAAYHASEQLPYDTIKG